MYLDRFNTYRKADSESYVAFASRLKGLLNYYLESRRVDDFDGLFEILICDRIKSSLSEACLRHVLSVENATERGWLDVDGLSDAIDKYSACHNNNNRPQAFAIGQNATRAGTMRINHRAHHRDLARMQRQNQIMGADLRLCMSVGLVSVLIVDLSII